MGTPYLGEIRIFPFSFAPQGWALCNGQLLAIAQNPALFAILGPTYGGNGTTTFALPDLRGRAPMPASNGVTLGTAGGEAAHALTLGEAPAHTHPVSAAAGAATAEGPGGNLWANGAEPAYGPPGAAALATQAIAAAGGGQAHDNMQPYLAVNFAIALQGIFPTRN